MRAIAVAPLSPRGEQRIGRLGLLLAALALLLQVALPGSFTPLPVPTDSDASGFEHALCLGSREGTKEPPAKPTPGRDHYSHAACCFWHGSAGLGLASTAPAEPVAFTAALVVFLPFGQVVSPRLAGPLGARAPPLRA